MRYGPLLIVTNLMWCLVMVRLLWSLAYFMMGLVHWSTIYMFLRFWCVTQWTFGHFLLFCLIETLVFGPIPPMPVNVIDYLERPLLVKSRSVVILP
jgi:hypothetical protein